MAIWDLELDGLVEGDGLSELPAGFGVGNGGFIAARATPTEAAPTEARGSGRRFSWR